MRENEIMARRGDSAEAIPIESLNLLGELLHFALSLDGSQVASLVQGNFDGEEHAYVISALNGEEQQILQIFTSFLPYDELPFSIAWSPDRQWLALAPVCAPLHGLQILLVSPDGSEG